MTVIQIVLGLTLLGIILYVRKFFIQKKKEKIGKLGEHKVDRKLRLWLSWGGAKIYEDVSFVSASGGTTQIDHIVLSRKGIICIETKNLSGKLKGNLCDKNWTHWNNRGDKCQIYNSIYQNHAHVKHLANVLKVGMNDIDGFVTNVGGAKLKGNINPMIGKAAIESGTDFILKLFFRSNSKFTKEEVNIFKDLLDEKIKEADEDIQRIHKKYVQKIKGDTGLNFVLKYLYFCYHIIFYLHNILLV